jgi:hypothetical protein
MWSDPWAGAALPFGGTGGRIQRHPPMTGTGGGAAGAAERLAGQDHRGAWLGRRSPGCGQGAADHRLGHANLRRQHAAGDKDRFVLNFEI